jgi:short-subunit dehydrogenase
MQKTILITGSTDGIGLETAKLLAAAGHNVLLHGRSPHKLTEAAKILSGLSNGGSVETYLADLSRMADVEALADAVTGRACKA